MISQNLCYLFVTFTFLHPLRSPFFFLFSKFLWRSGLFKRKDNLTCCWFIFSYWTMYEEAAGFTWGTTKLDSSGCEDAFPAFLLALFHTLLSTSSSFFEYVVSLCLSSLLLYSFLKVLSFLIFQSSSGEAIWRNVRTTTKKLCGSPGELVNWWTTQLMNYSTGELLNWWTTHMVNYSTEALQLRSPWWWPSPKLRPLSSLFFSLPRWVAFFTVFVTFTSTTFYQSWLFFSSNFLWKSYFSCESSGQ